MAESALAKKMKLKASQRAAVLRTPPGFLDELAPLPKGTTVSTQLDGSFDWVQVFVQTKAELDALLPEVRRALKPVSILWLSFPKGTSKLQTDLTRDKGWDSLRNADLKWITLVSVNETWSAFSLRPYRPGEPKQAGR